MGTFENRIEHNAEELGWNAMRVASVASKFGIRGASETALSKAFNGLKDLPTHETALPLDLLLGRFLKMCDQFKPFEVRLDDPEQAKQLLEDFEAGRLTVLIGRLEPDSSIYFVHLIENLRERNKLFQGIQSGEPSWGTQGTPIKDRAIADAAVKVLRDMGHPCHVFSTSVRTVESKIAKTLLDLGFVFQEETNGTN
jgi:hypothetical protein